MKKRIWGIVLALGLCLGLLPTAALAEGDVDEYNLWIGGTQVTSANADDVLDDGGTVSFTPATENAPATLTLNNAAITVAAGNGDRIGISWKEESASKPLTINLIGDNTVTAGNVNNGSSVYGNYSIGVHGLTSIRITGAGTLTAKSGDATADSHHSYGIYLYKGTLTVDDGVTLNCTAGTGGITSCGIRVFLNGMIHVGKGAKVTASAGQSPSGDSVGICCDDGNITFGNDSRVTGTGDEAHRNSYGISAKSDTTLKYNTTLEAKGYDSAVNNSLKFTPADGECTASENYNGSDSATYEAANHETYRYINVISAHHIHDYDENTWSSNSEKHWHECTVEDCTDLTGSIKEEAEHVYENDADSTCNVCGYVRHAAPPVSPAYIPATFPIHVELGQDADGFVSFPGTGAVEEDRVTVTVTAKRHYRVDALIVRDAQGRQLPVQNNGDGTFTFKMPAGSATVTPGFSRVNPFVDVENDVYYIRAVEWMLNHEVTQGTTDNTFSPDAACTRGQIVTSLWRVAGTPEPGSMTEFSDVFPDSYYAEAVAWAVENGITDGTGNGLFGPGNNCTRSQIAAFLCRCYVK